jgi:hypothetical protein
MGMPGLFSRQNNQGGNNYLRWSGFSPKKYPT